MAHFHSSTWRLDRSVDRRRFRRGIFPKAHDVYGMLLGDSRQLLVHRCKSWSIASVVRRQVLHRTWSRNIQWSWVRFIHLKAPRYPLIRETGPCTMQNLPHQRLEEHWYLSTNSQQFLESCRPSGLAMAVTTLEAQVAASRTLPGGSRPLSKAFPQFASRLGSGSCRTHPDGS